MTYNDRVRRMAEKMAENAHNQLFAQGRYDRSWQEWKIWMINSGYDKIVEVEIEKQIPPATLAVSEQADAVKRSYDAAWLFTSRSVEQRERYKMKFLLANGYRPQNEQP